jgi:uncharacterized RDD family membrane protein YckC
MSQNNLASLWSRVGAALIDLIIILLAAAMAMFFWGVIEGLQQVSADELTWKARGFLIGLAIDLAYSVALMAGVKQSTYGQRALGIRVRKFNGANVELGSALGRYLVSLVSSVILKLGFFIAVFTKHKQTLHDLAAGTIVVYDLEPQARAYADTPTSTPAPRSSDFVAAPQVVAGANSMPARAVPIQQNATSSSSNESQELVALNDEELYELALNEITDGGKRPGLWAMALEQTTQGGSTEGSYIALRVKQLKAERQTQAEAKNSRIDSGEEAAVCLESNRYTEEAIFGHRCLLLPHGQWVLCTTSTYRVYKDKPSLLESIEFMRTGRNPSVTGLVITIAIPEDVPMPGPVDSTQGSQEADIQAAINRDDNVVGSHGSPQVRGTKSMLGTISLFTFVGLAAVVFYYQFSDPLETADLKALSKDDLVSKFTDRKLSWKVRSAFGSKLVSSGRLYVFTATQIPYPAGVLYSQATSNTIEGAQTWWRESNETTLMVLYNPTPLEINGIRLNVYSGKCNVTENPEMAVMDYKLGTSLRSGDLVAYRLDGLMTYRHVASLTKKPGCIDVVSTW